MSWRKRVAVALGVLGALLLALLGALTWVIGSERGTTWLITTFVSAPPAFTVGRIEGTLLDGVALGDVAIRMNADRIEARDGHGPRGAIAAVAMVDVERRWPQRKIRTGIAFVPRGKARLQPLDVPHGRD